MSQQDGFPLLFTNSMFAMKSRYSYAISNGFIKGVAKLIHAGPTRPYRRSPRAVELGGSMAPHIQGGDTPRSVHAKPPAGSACGGE